MGGPQERVLVDWSALIGPLGDLTLLPSQEIHRFKRFQALGVGAIQSQGYSCTVIQELAPVEC
jgi:hypothetical protein